MRVDPETKRTLDQHKVQDPPIETEEQRFNKLMATMSAGFLSVTASLTRLTEEVQALNGNFQEFMDRLDEQDDEEFDIDHDRD